MTEIKDEIILRGLKENNLKNVDINIPKEKIIVFTGLSGSGKSSVVFDTLATESRRYFDKSLREYAVRFKPLSPSGWQGNWMMTCGLFDPDKPIKDYSEEDLHLLLYGPREGERAYAPFHTKNGPHNAEWDGLLPRFTRVYINRDISKLKQISQDDVLAVSTHSLCPMCQGSLDHRNGSGRRKTRRTNYI